MECNKEEALRAMDIAKRKVTENDYEGAKKFANKAQNLYPKLDGLKQVMMVIYVYIAAGNKISGGESDWYGILGVDPLADEDSVKKQYKRLALLLHPDKNKCDGAEGAFKLVSAAWSLLSDKVKRLAYDQQRKLNQVKPKKSQKQKQPRKKPPSQPKQPPNQQKQSPNQPKQPPHQQKQSPNQQKQPPNQEKQSPNQPKQPPNQQKQSPNQPKQPPNQQQQPEKQQPPNQPSSNGFRNGKARSKKPISKVPTFWTMCNKCGTDYEYIRVYYLNKNVLCRNCRVNFKATEKEKTPTDKEETAQATNKNKNDASSCGRDSSPTVSVGHNCRMSSYDNGNVANEAEEKDEEAARETAKSDLNVEERVFKKLRTDHFADASCGIKV